MTHDQEEALELADRVVVMNEGRIEQVGTPDEVYQRPATPFVFDFLGDANWLATTVQGRKARVGFRPDELEISLGPLDGHSFAARVRRVQSFGARAKLELVSASGTRVQADVPAERVRSLSLSPGAEIFAAPRELQVFFDDVQSASREAGHLPARTMGPQSTRETLDACARSAEAAGLDEIFVPDHIAIPPDDAEGSGGRYLDPLTALTWLAARTERIGLGTAVLILPYRPALPTAKAIATLQELSGGRLTALGVGVGWMEPEFRALGVPRSAAAARHRPRARVPRARVRERRGRAERPAVPVPAAAARGRRSWWAARRRTRWRAPRASATAGCRSAGSRPTSRRTCRACASCSRPRASRRPSLGDDPPAARGPGRAADLARAYAELGATRLVHSNRYADAAEFARAAEAIAGRIRPALA